MTVNVNAGSTRLYSTYHHALWQGRDNRVMSATVRCLVGQKLRAMSLFEAENPKDNTKASCLMKDMYEISICQQLLRYICYSVHLTDCYLPGLMPKAALIGAFSRVQRSLPKRRGPS